jgi:hypothetical protein
VRGRDTPFGRSARRRLPRGGHVGDGGNDDKQASRVLAQRGPDGVGSGEVKKDRGVAVEVDVRGDDDGQVAVDARGDQRAERVGGEQVPPFVVTAGGVVGADQHEPPPVASIGRTCASPRTSASWFAARRAP